MTYYDVLKEIAENILNDYKKYYVGDMLYIPISETKILNLSVNSCGCRDCLWINLLTIVVYHKDKGVIVKQDITNIGNDTIFFYDNTLKRYKVYPNYNLIENELKKFIELWK